MKNLICLKALVSCTSFSWMTKAERTAPNSWRGIKTEVHRDHDSFLPSTSWPQVPRAPTWVFNTSLTPPQLSIIHFLFFDVNNSWILYGVQGEQSSASVTPCNYMINPVTIHRQKFGVSTVSLSGCFPKWSSISKISLRTKIILNLLKNNLWSAMQIIINQSLLDIWMLLILVSIIIVMICGIMCRH